MRWEENKARTRKEIGDRVVIQLAAFIARDLIIIRQLEAKHDELRLGCLATEDIARRLQEFVFIGIANQQHIAVITRRRGAFVDAVFLSIRRAQRGEAEMRTLMREVAY